MEEKTKLKLEIFEEEILLFLKNFVNSLSPIMRWIFYVCLIGFIPVYFVGYGSGYFINKANLSKYLVTAKQSFTEQDVKPLRQIGGVVLLPNGDGQSAYVKLKNDNLELSIASGDYTFQFFNESGSLVASVTDSFYAGSNELFYLVVPKFLVKSVQDKAVTGTIKFDNLTWIRRLVLPRIDLTAGIAKINKDPKINGSVVVGGFTNNTQYYLKSVRSIILVFDNKKNIIAVSSRDSLDVLPGTQRDIQQVFPGTTFPDDASATIISKTNIFDNSNLRFDSSSGNNSVSPVE